ncbi:MAG: hypothetical protein EA382_01005 [Spirochaetaceae bacterium]|nr:MAG: hypothetical protein EA382_01005 [Spirochaetaceae bacterium]
MSEPSDGTTPIADMPIGSIPDGLPTDYFPPARDRETWGRVERQDADAIVSDAERLMDVDWPVLPAVRYADYRRNGDRSRFEEVYFGRRARVTANLLAEAVENRGRFVEEIVTGCIAICEETSWTVPAHNGPYRDGVERVLADPTEPIVDLFSAETGSLLSAVVRMVGPQLDGFTPMVSERITREVRTRLIDPFVARDDFWWMGFGERETNNWNPWIVSSLLSSLYALRPDPGLATTVVRKALRCLERFVDIYADDGGCDEGASYWGHAAGSLFDAADLLRHMTGGAIDLLSIPKVSEMGRYLYRVHIDRSWFVNYADGPAWIDTASPQLVYRFGKAIGDDRLAALGVELFRTLTPLGADPDRDRYVIRAIWSLLHAGEFRTSTLVYEPCTDAWLPGIQVIAARSESRPRLFWSAKGGDNHESHNHNDVGSFVLFCDGLPVIIDPGVERYTAKTFSDDRYTIWTMRSAYHNLPIINATEQRADSAADPHPAAGVAARVGADAVEFELDIAPAYPTDSGVESWTRRFLFDRADPGDPSLSVAETVVLSQPSGSAELVFMTWAKPDLSPTGFRVRAGDPLADATDGPTVAMAFDPASGATIGSPTVERIATDDPRLTKVWGAAIHRVVIPVTFTRERSQIAYRFAPVRR